jgi:hypothetical protein
MPAVGDEFGGVEEILDAPTVAREVEVHLHGVARVATATRETHGTAFTGDPLPLGLRGQPEAKGFEDLCLCPLAAGLNGDGRVDASAREQEGLDAHDVHRSRLREGPLHLLLILAVEHTVDGKRIIDARAHREVAARNEHELHARRDVHDRGESGRGTAQTAEGVVVAQCGEELLQHRGAAAVV